MQQIILRSRSVVKVFSSSTAFEAELRVYNEKLPFCPKLLSFKAPRHITLSRIPGDPFLDGIMISQYELLGQTLAAFHQAFRQGERILCHWDNNPSNILLSQGRFFLIDFEDSRWDRPEHDLTHLLLFIRERLDGRSFSEAKQRLLYGYQEVLRLDPLVWESAIRQSYQRFVERRRTFNKKIPPVLDSIDSILNNLRLC